MRQVIREDVSVHLVYDRKTQTVTPKHLRWQGQLHTISKVGLHHTYRRGRTLMHVFSVTDGTTFFRLELDTDNLHWTLMEVSDGEPD